MRSSAAALALLLPLLGGCLGMGGPAPTTTTPPTSDTTTEPPTTFDGEAALGFVRLVALRDDGEARFRVPGSPGQAEGALALWDALDAPGWERRWQNFTGQDYLALDLSPVAIYGPGSRFCSEADHQALPSLRFHNLYAVKQGTDPDGPLLLLAAHWDSKAHSDADANASRRDWPYPGANDGASGVGVLLQLMRELEGIELPFDVGVFFVDGEDGFHDCHALAGSLMFAQNPPVAVHRVLVLDMVGDPEARFVREQQSMQSDPALMDALWAHGRAAGGEAHFTDTRTTVVDDHVAFLHEGIPASDLIDAGRPTTFPPHWHTTEDTVDKLSPRTLGIVGDALLGLLRDPVLTGPWPAPTPP